MESIENGLAQHVHGWRVVASVADAICIIGKLLQCVNSEVEVIVGNQRITALTVKELISSFQEKRVVHDRAAHHYAVYSTICGGICYATIV